MIAAVLSASFAAVMFLTGACFPGAVAPDAPALEAVDR